MGLFFNWSKKNNGIKIIIFELPIFLSKKILCRNFYYLLVSFLQKNIFFNLKTTLSLKAKKIKKILKNVLFFAF